MSDRPGTTDWRALLAGFVSDLGTGEDQVPLERALQRELAATLTIKVSETPHRSEPDNGQIAMRRRRNLGLSSPGP